MSIDESGSSFSSNSTHLGTIAKSLLECLQTPKYSELSRKRWALQDYIEASMVLQYNRVKNDDS